MGECSLSIVSCGKIVSIDVVKICRMNYFVGIITLADSHTVFQSQCIMIRHWPYICIASPTNCEDY